MLRSVNSLNGPLGSSQANTFTQPRWTAPNPSFFSTRLAHLLQREFGGQGALIQFVQPRVFQGIPARGSGDMQVFPPDSQD